MVSLALPLLIPVAYAAGSIPFGLLVGKAKGLDVRTAGSGNIGATNVGRLLGRRYFLLVFALDALKGLVVMVVAAPWASRAGVAGLLLWLAAGLAVIVGHMFSVFLKFKGGKGVATSAGVVLGVWPFLTWPAVAALLLFSVVLATTRYMSVASITAAIAFPIAFGCIGGVMGWHPLGSRLPLMLFAVLIAVMIVYRHRGNISRLRAGTEGRLGTVRADRMA